jgi:hypothetical protein
MIFLEMFDLLHAAGVPTGLKLRFQPDADHPIDQLIPQEVGRQTQDVGVVVSATHLGGNAVVAGSGPDAMDLIRGNTHADAGAANQNTAINPFLSHRPGHLECEVGIVNAVVASRAHILDLVAKLLQQRDDPFLGLEASMIAADGDFHGSNLILGSWLFEFVNPQAMALADSLPLRVHAMPK